MEGAEWPDYMNAHVCVYVGVHACMPLVQSNIFNSVYALDYRLRGSQRVNIGATDTLTFSYITLGLPGWQEW